MSSTKPFSLSLGPKKVAGSSTLTPRKRPHSSLTAEGSGSEGEENSQPQLVSAFDSSAGGAIGGKSQNKSPLIIPVQKNRSWQDEAQRKKSKKNLLPQEEQARRDGPVETSDLAENKKDSSRAYGLVITRKSSQGSTSHTRNGDDEATQSNVSAERISKSADEEAIEALLGDKKKDSGLIIANIESVHSNSLPDMASIEDYTLVPVEEFGRAMMRGMGWKEGEEIGRRKGTPIKEPKGERRLPAGAGIGADKTPEDPERLGAWGKNVKKSKKAEAHFSLMVKNPKTGEVLTEEEFEALKENQKLLVEDTHRERLDKSSSKDRERRGERRGEKREERRHQHKFRERYPEEERYRDRHQDSGAGRRRERSSSPVSRSRDRDRHQLRENERDYYRSYESKGERHKEDSERKHRSRDDDQYRSSRRRSEYDERAPSHRKHRDRDSDQYRISNKHDRH